MKLGEAKAIVGSIGFPSKMPGTSYGLPAQACKTGAKLAKIAGSACAACYALKDRWTWTNPQKSMGRRLEAIKHPSWSDAMVRLLSHIHSKDKIRVDLGISGQRLQRKGGVRWRLNDTGFHRWHDSGDLQSVEHFTRICEVARRTPTIRHWLPTQELWMVKEYQNSGGIIPSNLVVRVSSVLINDPKSRAWPQTSSVFSGAPPKTAYVCPAPTQGNLCGSCRMCWSTEPHIAYHFH